MPAGWVMVTGPQSSGTRLLCDILTAGGLDVWHDKSHGTSERDAERVVVIVRDPAATRASREVAFPEAPIARDDSIAGCARYTEALWVTYEQVCDNPAAVVALLAEWLAIEPWPLTFPIVNQNAKWAHGGGPQLVHQHTW